MLWLPYILAEDGVYIVKPLVIPISYAVGNGKTGKLILYTLD